MCKISIVILTFNSENFIKSCLVSIFAQGNCGFEVIVVDNGSKDETVNFIKKDFPQVILIENKENFGACKARNQGITAASEDWVLTLDCDIILETGFLYNIKNFIKNLSPKIGIIQPKILKSDRITIYSTGIFLSSLRRFYDIGEGKIDNWKFSKSNYVFGACSAAAVYKKQMLEEIKEDTGYFDERFFFLVEDVDLAWRAQRMRWKALYHPAAVSYHFGNSSSLNKAYRQFLCWRNRNLMLKKHRINRLRSALIYVLYDLPRLVFLFFSNAHVRKDVLKKTKLAWSIKRSLILFAK